MAEHMRNQEVLFYNHFGWCLLEEAIDDGMCRPSAYWNHHRSRGIKEGWLTKNNRLQALQMLVLFDQVLLAGFDVDLESQ
jgi:hypothetical protein